jgi:hypothetical protein
MGSRPVAAPSLRDRGDRRATRHRLDQVVEHALRHLAWLAEDDPVVREELSPAWRAALATYVPEPFRNLG